ncbi:hypothetical protein BH11CYA1_BH11CYA1_10180 [soil metagenome]
MRESTITKELRRGNINMLIVGLCLAISSGAFLVLTARTNINDVLGPVAMTPDEVINVKDPSKLLRYYISTRGSKVSDTVWQERREVFDRATQKTVPTSVVNEIQMMQLADKVVLIRRTRNSNDPSIAGALINTPSDLEELSNKLRQDPKLKTQLLPLLIDSTRFNWSSYFFILVFIPLFIGGIILIHKSISRLFDKFQNPNISSLSRFGDPQAVLSEIEEELSKGESVFRCSMLWLTKNWLVTSKLTGLEIRNVKELVWFYPQVTSHRVYGVVHVGKSNDLIICDSSGRYTQVYLPSDDFDYIGESLRERAPWAFSGFELEREQRWQKKNRAAMIAEVEKRRLALQNKEN